MSDFIWYVDMVPTLLYWAMFLAQDSCLFAAASLVSTAKLPWRDWAVAVGLAHCLLGYLAMGATAVFFANSLPLIYLISIACLSYFVWHHLQHVLGRCSHDHSAEKYTAIGRLMLFWRAVVFSVDSLGYGPIVMGQASASGAESHTHIAPVIQNSVQSGDVFRAAILMGGVGIFITGLMLVFCWLMNKTSMHMAAVYSHDHSHSHGNCCSHHHSHSSSRKEQVIHGLTALLLLNLVGQLLCGFFGSLRLIPFELEESLRMLWLGASVALLGAMIYFVETAGSAVESPAKKEVASHAAHSHRTPRDQHHPEHQTAPLPVGHSCGCHDHDHDCHSHAHTHEPSALVQIEL